MFFSPDCYYWICKCGTIEKVRPLVHCMTWVSHPHLLDLSFLTCIIRGLDEMIRYSRMGYHFY